MTEENHSCCDCEYHAKANHIHVCSQGIQVTTALLVGDESCSQWEQLDVERRQAKDAEIASLVTRPEQPKNNWELMERAMLADLENSRRLPPGYLSGYPSREEDERIRRMHERIPYPRGRQEMDRHRLVPTLRELQEVQAYLPDPNTCSDSSILKDVAIQDYAHRHTARRLTLQFTKSVLHDHNGRSFAQWVYHGHVMMDDQSNPEMEGEWIRQRDEEIRRDYYRLYGGIQSPNPPTLP